MESTKKEKKKREMFDTQRVFSGYSQEYIHLVKKDNLFSSKMK